MIHRWIYDKYDYDMIHSYDMIHRNDMIYSYDGIHRRYTFPTSCAE